jgi:hypothetical protein
MSKTSSKRPQHAKQHQEKQQQEKNAAPKHISHGAQRQAASPNVYAAFFRSTGY